MHNRRDRAALGNDGSIGDVEYKAAGEFLPQIILVLQRTVWNSYVPQELGHDQSKLIEIVGNKILYKKITRRIKYLYKESTYKKF